MADAADEMNHQDVWDDSALVQSWNEALAEYKHAKPETHLYQHGQPAPGPIAGEASESVVDGQGTNADTATEGAATTQVSKPGTDLTLPGVRT
ncbi:hypothetical protein N0V82_001933 [Gnomoniopsis sp. IMI 355080]|nr:hypothetical protein N0V82_001933 [Gnomoniopsis sp. IMI 355080]